MTATSPSPLESSPPSSVLDTLAGQWWEALQAAQAALHSAGPYLRGNELAEHSQRLTQDRSDAVRLLQELSDDWQTDTPLLGWLATPAVSRRLLGLPDDVAACVFDLDGVLTTGASSSAGAETAFTGSRCYLEAAGALGLRRAVVSASANARTILERAGFGGLLEEHVDRNVIEAEQLERKPAPDTLLFACERLQVQPAESVAFETAPAGIRAARAAGFRMAVGVERNGDAGALLASDADAVVGDLAELLNHRLPPARVAGSGRSSAPRRAG